MLAESASRLLRNPYAKYLPAGDAEAVHFCSGMIERAPTGWPKVGAKGSTGRVRAYVRGGSTSVPVLAGLSTPSVPRAAILPAADAFPLRIHSNATPIRAPTKGPTT